MNARWKLVKRHNTRTSWKFMLGELMLGRVIESRLNVDKWEAKTIDGHGFPLLFSDPHDARVEIEGHLRRLSMNLSDAMGDVVTDDTVVEINLRLSPMGKIAAALMEAKVPFSPNAPERYNVGDCDNVKDPLFINVGEFSMVFASNGQYVGNYVPVITSRFEAKKAEP